MQQSGSKGGLIILGLMLTCFLAGCGSSRPDSSWQRIQEQGTIRVGMDANWLPFEYVDGEGELSGFDVELAWILGERLGLEVQFVANLSFDGLYDALTAQLVDVVISAAVVDAGRSADFAYSLPYFEAGQVLVVGPNGSDIRSMGDLSGRVLAVELGSDGDAVARRWARRLPDVVLSHAESAAGALDSVADGHADAALTDRASALLGLRALGQRRTAVADADLQLTGKPVSGEQYAAVVRHESRGLLRALNAALKEMRRDGTLAELERKWLGP